jgi:hypothetical protein
MVSWNNIAMKRKKKVNFTILIFDNAQKLKYKITIAQATKSTRATNHQLPEPLFH